MLDRLRAQVEEHVQRDPDRVYRETEAMKAKRDESKSPEVRVFYFISFLCLRYVMNHDAISYSCFPSMDSTMKPSRPMSGGNWRVSCKKRGYGVIVMHATW